MGLNRRLGVRGEGGIDAIIGWNIPEVHFGVFEGRKERRRYAEQI